MRLVIPFDTSEGPALAEVGGKGLSLIRMTQGGLPVPGGFLLTQAFFEPWLEDVRQSPQWQEALAASPEQLPQRVAAVKAHCGPPEFDEARRKALAEALERLDGRGEATLHAARSSSPEEDLEGASFAGGYETVLGVTPDRLEEAIRRCALSCLSERVILYKREHGFDVERPSIAVIVQQQIAAETAGVAFSLNPINNCYDQCVINANFGLGESVVSGRVSPDQFIVDKPSLEILARKTGSKETSIWLQPDGGTKEQPDDRRGELCLSDEDVVSLTRMVTDVEAAFGKPMDIEWAFAKDTLYLLQARPITAYFPLPEEMQTRPGEPKRLYWDQLLSKGGMDTPMSPLGTEYWDLFARLIMRNMTGVEPFGIDRGMWFIAFGRAYANLSSGLRSGGKKRLVKMSRVLDAISSEIIAELDEKEYKAKKLPKKVLLIPLLAPFYSGGLLWRVPWVMFCPDRRHDRFREDTELLERDLAAEEAKQASLRDFTTNCCGRFSRYFSRDFLPCFVAVQIARARIQRLFRKAPEEVRSRVVFLERALPNNCTIEMGLSMFRLARFADVRDCPSAAEFTGRLRARSLSGEFLAAWDEFISRYGHRCPAEHDPATPRLYERPEALYAQLRALAQNTDEETSPQAIFERGVAERESAYEFLLGEARKIGRRAEKTLTKSYRILVTFGGYRELPKDYMIRITEIFRRRVLAAGRSFCEAGRLDRPEDAFHLKIDEIDAGQRDPSLDLRAMAYQNAAYLRRLRFVREFPRIIDSRGCILRAPKKEAREGELLGEPISPGIVQGKVKVLTQPDEKPVLPGEILVARTTDPGWTPLFLNAGGIVLEVGGMLQHGAVVAREYCKPCVAGIESVTSLLQDGQLVELDGTNGTIRLVA